MKPLRARALCCALSFLAAAGPAPAAEIRPGDNLVVDGIPAIPDSVAEAPITPCMKRGTYMMEPTIPAPTRNIEITETVIQLAKFHNWMVVHFRPAWTEVGWRRSPRAEAQPCPGAPCAGGRAAPLLACRYCPFWGKL